MRVVARLTEVDYARWRRDARAQERALLEPGRPAAPAATGASDRESEGRARERQTEVLIAKWGALYEKDSAQTILPLLDRWHELDRIGPASDKQKWLEPLIQSYRRAPDAHRGELIFLLVIFEPIRASVTAELRRLSVGLNSGYAPQAWHQREEVRRIDELERERVDDVTRYALLDAIERYPSPRKLFPWLRESLAYRAVDFLRSELSDATPKGMYRDEADALQAALHGLDDIEAPRFHARQRPRRDLWQMRELFAVAGDYAENTAVRRVILKAVGRLAPAQRWAVEEFHLRGQPAQVLASQRGVTESTIYNTTAAARRKLRRDDEFFSALHGLGAVRDEARIKAIRTRYPEGRLPDGRRVVVITEAD